MVDKWREEHDDMKKNIPTLLIFRIPTGRIGFDTQEVLILQDNAKIPTRPTSDVDTGGRNGGFEIYDPSLASIRKNVGCVAYRYIIRTGGVLTLSSIAR